MAFSRMSIAAIAAMFLLCGAARGGEYAVSLHVRSEWAYPRVPMDPKIDFGKLLADAGESERLDPNSIAVVDLTDGKRAEAAITEDFAYGDAGRVEWVITNPAHREFEIRFSSAPTRPPRTPERYAPLIGTGDLLRYNAGTPRPIACCYVSGLYDLTGDGQPDLVGAWNYAYRPGSPWDGLICYPRAGAQDAFTFGDLVRLRYAETPETSELHHFESTYMTAAFADFNRDGRIDLLFSPRSGDALQLFLNSGNRDAGGMPVFVKDAVFARPAEAWLPCRAVDLNQDGALDLVLGAVYKGDAQKNYYLRNLNAEGWPMEFAEAVELNLEKAPCFFDVDSDGKPDAVALQEITGGGVYESRVIWQRNLGGEPPRFDTPSPVPGVAPHYPDGLAAVEDGARKGILVQYDVGQRVSFYAHIKGENGQFHFEETGCARSLSAVMSLSDQAWPWPCDWDGDGDLDLLVGGGYGWPRIVLNEGTRERPAYAEPQYILSEGKPILIRRNDILGEPFHWHNMSYTYPSYMDWDGDALPDLLLPNETNRILWCKNIGTRQQPEFGPRRQIEVDGYSDSPESRRRSAERALEATYPQEEEQPFFWRTGAAFYDWNGDGLMDLATHGGASRQLTLFTQYRDSAGVLRLKKERPLLLNDGRPIDDRIVERAAHWTECFRPVDWDRDGLMDLLYSCAGTEPAKGSIYLLRNTGSKENPVFAAPRTMCCFGEPIKVTAHGPSAWAGDFDGDGMPDVLACTEWSVYPFFTYAALEMPERPAWDLGPVRRSDGRQNGL